MNFLTDEATLFFLQRPETLPLWEALAPVLAAEFPEAVMTVHKTQITFARADGLSVPLPARPEIHPQGDSVHPGELRPVPAL